jgi:putative ABC transport system permease protein
LVLSHALAQEHHLRIGQTFRLPSPSPAIFRVAALSTNIGWAPGAIVMNAADYARAWGSDDASGYNVLLGAGHSPGQAVREIRRALGPGSGLAVQSAEQHASRQRTLSRTGLARLTQIAVLIMIGAVLAMAAAMGTMVWQRRPRLAKLKLEGSPAPSSGARSCSRAWCCLGQAAPLARCLASTPSSCWPGHSRMS